VPSDLSITVLGCDGTYPAPDGACSGYLVRSGTTTIWLDAGSGTLAELQRHVRLADVDAVVISHRHPDHWLDLALARNVVRYIQPRPPLPLLAPTSLLDDAATMFDLDEGSFEPDDVADGDHRRVGDIDLRFSRTDHPPVTLAVHCQSAGATLAYSADTGGEWSMAAFGVPVDLAIWEATYPDGGNHVRRRHHATPTETGTNARDAGVGRLVLTHLLPGTDHGVAGRAAADAFGADVDVARPGARFAASPPPPPNQETP